MIDNKFSSDSYLIRQVVSGLSDCLGSSGIEMLLFDRAGNLQTDNVDILESFGDDCQMFNNICTRIDDGDEPIVCQIDSVGIVASALNSRDSLIGYVFILLPGYSPERTVGCLDFLEIIISLISMNIESIETGLISDDIDDTCLDFYLN